MIADRSGAGASFTKSELPFANCWFSGEIVSGEIRDAQAGTLHPGKIQFTVENSHLASNTGDLVRARSVFDAPGAARLV